MKVNRCMLGKEHVQKVLSMARSSLAIPTTSLLQQKIIESL